MASLFTFVKPAKFLDTIGDVARPGLKKFKKDGKDRDKDSKFLNDSLYHVFHREINKSYRCDKICL